MSPRDFGNNEQHEEGAGDVCMSESKPHEWQHVLSAVPSAVREQFELYAECLLESTLDTLLQALDRRDPLTAGHCLRVKRYSLLIGDKMSVSLTERKILQYAALLHDFGKIGVPEAILWKNGCLTPEEQAIVQQHAKITYDLLSQLPFTPSLSQVPFVASCHHENLDGSGYYRNLQGDEIPLLSRIIAVANVFDNLTSVRHYGERTSMTKVHELLQSQRESQLDPKVLDALYALPPDQVLEIVASALRGHLPTLTDS